MVVNDVLYYTLPSIAALVFPEPELVEEIMGVGLQEPHAAPPQHHRR